jgi:hypothetical protein
MAMAEILRNRLWTKRDGHGEEQKRVKSNLEAFDCFHRGHHCECQFLAFLAPS